MEKIIEPRKREKDGGRHTQTNKGRGLDCWAPDDKTARGRTKKIGISADS